MQHERRKTTRHHVSDNAFAVINTEPVRLVPILDIALDGIGVYINSEDKWLRKATKIEIMVADCSFYLENLPFESISDAKAFPADSASIMDGRRCSLKFGKLTPGQKSELKYFIRNYTQGSTLRQFIQTFKKMVPPFRTNKHSAPSCNTAIWQNLQRPTM